MTIEFRSRDVRVETGVIKGDVPFAMRLGRHIGIAAIGLAMVGFCDSATAEIVERELGTDSAGNAVKGYVFQAGRGFGRSSWRRSALPVRRVSRSRWSGRGIRTGFGYPYGYYYVPFTSFHYGSPLSFCRVPARHFGGASFSVRIFR